jgi:hypothetical protein
MIFGASYESCGVIPDGSPRPSVTNPVTDYVPTGRPGGRAPHVWLERAGTRVSTLDLFGHGFVLLAGPRGAGWREAGRTLEVDAFTVGAGCDLGDPDQRWRDVRGRGRRRRPRAPRRTRRLAQSVRRPRPRGRAQPDALSASGPRASCRELSRR